VTDQPVPNSANVERPDPASPAGMDCPFCRPAVRAAAIARHGTMFAIPDAHPVSEGHALLITLRHTPDFFTMTAAERRDAGELLQVLRDRAMRDDPAITGFTVGCNCGESAGQKIAHAHIHFIPRRESDGPEGRGLKGVIRNRIEY
jgi:diadenosine tetraphosphate (Ap4A) HIT family hydrolase